VSDGKKSRKEAASPGKGEAASALSEGEDGRKTFKWQGLELTRLGFGEVDPSYNFDLIDYQDAPSMVNLLRLVKRVLEPESYARMRLHLSRLPADEQSEAIDELVPETLGLGSGES
jgi:hypothetical protein